jgi:glycosyltransferase involved in cell wall biosynthesis
MTQEQTQNRKKRILFCNEFSGLFTGYSTYGRNIISNLYQTGKYEIAELALYLDPRNPASAQFPWRIYGNLPTNEQEQNEYSKDVSSQFGAWRLGDVCLDFKPDIVVTINDFWMSAFIQYHPLRKYFQHIYMPAIDSSPPSEQWISQLCDTDRILVYSEYGQRVIENQMKGRVNVFGVSPIGVNDKFHPILDKRSLRIKYGIDPDSFIIGMSSRNQKRKLYPDLIQAFSLFIKQHPKEKIYLALHTSLPDLGWRLCNLIKESGVSSKILVTYVCAQCKATLVLPFTDARRVCPVCHSIAMTMPNTNNAASEEQLNEIYNLWDICVQYAICEAQSVTPIESALAGIPCMVSDYSALSDVADHTGGYKIKIAHVFLEAETHQYRSYPCNQSLIENLNHFYKLTPSLRQKKGREAYIGARKFYNWQRTTKIWTDCIDSLEPKNNWDSPPRLHQPQTQIPQNVDNEFLVRWCLHNVLGQPELCNTYFAYRLLRDLNYGASTRQLGGMYLNEDCFLSHNIRYQPFTVKEMVQELTQLCNERNYFEQRRCGLIQEQPKPIVQFVKPSENEL